MLIKLQKTRFSSEYFIIEDARDVTYRDSAFSYGSEDDLVAAMTWFMNSQQPILSAPQHQCWYQIEADYGPAYKPDFSEGYEINHLTFTDRNGQRQEIRFDGMAYICNDDGKTIHRIKAGGCPSIYTGPLIASATIPAPSQQENRGIKVPTC